MTLTVDEAGECCPVRSIGILRGSRVRHARLLSIGERRLSLIAIRCITIALWLLNICIMGVALVVAWRVIGLARQHSIVIRELLVLLTLQ